MLFKTFCDSYDEWHLVVCVISGTLVQQWWVERTGMKENANEVDGHIIFPATGWQLPNYKMEFLGESLWLSHVFKSSFGLENVFSCLSRTEQNNNTTIKRFKTNKGTDKENPRRYWSIHLIFPKGTASRRWNPSIIAYSTGRFQA